MNYIPTASDLLDMSLAHFCQHADELIGKASQMTPDQRHQLRCVAAEIARLVEEKEAA